MRIFCAFCSGMQNYWYDLCTLVFQKQKLNFKTFQYEEGGVVLREDLRKALGDQNKLSDKWINAANMIRKTRKTNVGVVRRFCEWMAKDLKNYSKKIYRILRGLRMINMRTGSGM